jgi:2-oxoglutarate/2-oxoacid ferredoxin oxidoreductase subunit alpha
MTSPSAVETPADAPTAPRVNDFTIVVATVNGTGSQTANNTLIRAIMGMGVPVAGRNIFPSNIYGLPTWYAIRVCEQGWTARQRRANVVIAMNLATAKDDVLKAAPGAAVIYDQPMGLDQLRKDVVCYPVPFAKLVKEAAPDKPALWKLVTNMVYVGVAGHLLGLDPAAIDAALAKAFGSKPKALAVNQAAVKAGMRYAAEHLAKRDPYRVEARALTSGKILIDGNSASALGALMAGCTVLTWYPITPSSSLAEALQEYFAKYRRSETGEQRYAVVQAEDELAAVGMAIGAGWAGARSMTTTSGPGISLMSEFIGLAYYAEIPTVIVDVQRVGPSTGLPTRTMQGDLLFTAYNSHGDTKHPLLLPSSPQEAYEFTQIAFDLAERFQTPAFLMLDLELGMNNWLCEPFPYPTTQHDRGKVMTKEALEKLGAANWGRYADVDGDGIPWRTLPGTEIDGAAYFTRGTGHDEKARYTEDDVTYKRNLDRLAKKWETLRRAVPKPLVSPAAKPTKIGLFAFGTTHWPIEEARAALADKGVVFDYMRLRAFPFSDEVRDFFAAHDRVYVVEENRDGQMAGMLRIELPETADKIRSVLHYDGLPLDADSVVEEILAHETR